MAKNLVLDISEFQPNVNYNGLKKEGIVFSWIRISDGATYLDHKYEQHYNGMKKAGIPFGFYWYFRGWNKQDAAEEAAFVLSKIRGLGIDMKKRTNIPICIDVEEYTNTSGTMRDAVQGAIDYLVKAGIPKSRIVLYIANNHYDNFNLNTKGHFVWVPAYPSTGNTVYWDYAPTKGQKLWQFTSSYQLNSIPGGVDMSVFMNGGKLEDLIGKPKQELPPLSKNPSYYHSDKTKAVTIKRPCDVYDSYALTKAKKLKTLQPSNKEFKILKWWEEGEKSNQLSRLYIEYENGKKGWITGNLDYVNSVYFLAKEYSGKKYIEATRDQYIAEYNDLSGRLTKVKKGDKFKVEANVADKSGYARFKLSNGKYASARKNHWKFVK